MYTSSYVESNVNEQILLFVLDLVYVKFDV